MTWGFVTCGPNEALVVSGKLNFNHFELHIFEYWIQYNDNKYHSRYCPL